MRLLTLVTVALLGIAPVRAEDATSLFAPIARALHSPRCLNCHTAADFPRQFETGTRHNQNVVRGADGMGAPTLRCNACHQQSAAADGRLPGAPGWSMPPASMAWDGLDDTGLCRAITDPHRNGGRDTPQKVIGHMLTDPIVLQAWDGAGGRPAPVTPKDTFIAALRQWAAAGAHCPQ